MGELGKLLPGGGGNIKWASGYQETGGYGNNSGTISLAAVGFKKVPAVTLTLDSLANGNGVCIKSVSVDQFTWNSNVNTGFWWLAVGE